jgi:hypothetical protein
VPAAGGAAAAVGPPLAGPALSVLVPLPHARGDAVDHLRTWTHAQTLPRDRYQVVVASDGTDPALEDRVAPVLAPQDILVHRPGRDWMGLYDAAAARAHAPWLLLTECHCLADPGCLERTAGAVAARPELDVALLEHGHATPGAVGRMGARWFDEMYSRWAAPGEWPRLNLVGFAIRRQAYEAAGGLGPRYGLFAPAFLAARLHESGARFGMVAGARVVHVHEPDIGEHHAHSADYTRGECLARAEHDPRFCERYFGYADEWANRRRYEAEVARSLVAVLARAILRPGGRPGPRRWMVRELAARLPACVAGAGPYLAWERLALALGEAAAGRIPLPDRWRYASYLRAQEHVVRLTRLRSARRDAGPARPAVREPGRWPAEALDGDVLVGAHGLERHDGRWFRWTAPVAAFRLAPAPGDHALSLDTGGLRGAPLGYVRDVYVGARRIPRASLREDGPWLTIPLGPAASAGVTVLCQPLEPRRSGAGDARALGMPVFSVELTREG